MARLDQSQDVKQQATTEATIPIAPPLAEPALPASVSDRRPLSWLHAIGRFLAWPFQELPPAPRGRWPRIALILVGILALAFVVYFTAYTWSLFDAFKSNAEDMGIMDQALWNTLHGALLHQTICNNISDTNCIGDVSRFAIHFEPLMLPISLLYLIAPSPKTLMLLQALVVATGAFPAYWIACRRLASPLAGLGFATAYLLYPALQSAVIFDFHAVTLAAAFLMFALYFMLTRNNVGLFIACLLALSTKEEIPVDIIMIALAILVFQRRYRVGAALLGLSLVWLVLTVAVMHAFSPIGHSPTASRYAYMGSSPLQVGVYIITHPLQLIHNQILDPNGRFNLRTLTRPLAYLGILGPSAFILALPALLINLLSSDPHMQMGVHQYSAEITPFMIFAAIFGMAALVVLVSWAATRIYARLDLGGDARHLPPENLARRAANVWNKEHAITLPGGARVEWRQMARVALILALLLIMGVLTYRQNDLGDLPRRPNFIWPVPTAHTRLFSSVAALIPANASVSAQDTLVPHLSQRRYIYQYPYMANESSYVVLDTGGNIYPYPKTSDGMREYQQSVQSILNSGRFRVIFSEDGYLVLKRQT